MGVKQAIQVPLLAVNDTFLTVVEVKWKTGDFVKRGDCLMVFETSKTTYDVEAEHEGYIELLCEAGKDYEVNTVVAHIHDDPVFTPSILFVQDNRPESMGMVKIPLNAGIGSRGSDVFSWEGESIFSNAALAELEKGGLSREYFKGKAFVTREDVLKYLGKGTVTVTESPVVSETQKSSPTIPVDSNKVTVQSLSKNKKTEIQFLGSVQSAGLISTISVNVETNGLFVHINRSLKYFKDSLLPVIVYETSRLLRDFRELNAYYTPTGICFYNEVNIGFAVDMEKGLKVLKIASAPAKSLQQIEADIFVLSEKYLDEKVALEDLTEIGFTITDLSGEGVSSFIPLVNYMNSGILGVGAIDAKLERCTLSLTFDHRVTEGKLVARFLSSLKERIESYRYSEDHSFGDTIHCSHCFKSLNEDLSGIGFVKSINRKGEEKYICQTCFKGF